MDDEELRAFMRLQQQQIALQAEQISQLVSLVRGLAPTRPVVSTLTVRAIFEKYETSMKPQMKPRSWLAISARLKPVLVHFGEQVVSALGLADEPPYREKRMAHLTRRGVPMKPLSYANEFGAFVAMFNWAVRAGVIAENPFARLKLKKKATPRHTVYSEEDADIVLESANDWLRTMILLCKESGLRPIEILKLETTQIDRFTGMVHLRADQTKNSKPRSVKLSPRTLEAVNDLPRGIKWVFTNPKTGNHWSYRSLNDWWRAVAKETGLQGAAGETARFYDWRGTFATNMNRAGVSLPVIKQALGHSDYRQLEMYLRIDQQDISDGAERLEEHRLRQRRGPKRAPDKAQESNDASKKSKGT